MLVSVRSLVGLQKSKKETKISWSELQSLQLIFYDQFNLCWSECQSYNYSQTDNVNESVLADPLKVLPMNKWLKFLSKMFSEYILVAFPWSCTAKLSYNAVNGQASYTTWQRDWVHREQTTVMSCSHYVRLQYTDTPIKYKCKLVLQTLKLRMFDYFVSEHLNLNLRLHPSPSAYIFIFYVPIMATNMITWGIEQTTWNWPC